MIIQIIRYKSGLSQDEVKRKFVERSDRYRKIQGLIQKYYVKFTETDQYGGIYIWDSLESLETWTAGNLSGTIAETYKIKGLPEKELAEVMLVLHKD